MTQLDLFSEPYRPEGNIDARASRRALGHPAEMGLWELLLRETLQNSWDARLADNITYRVDAWFPDATQYSALKDEVFAFLPPTAAMDGVKPTRKDLPVLVVTDHGTKGLAGPTRADFAQAGPSDFVDFIRNIGRAEDKQLGGGTYGFGKGVLYEASVCSTIIVFTRTTHGERSVSRLMAVRLGSSYQHAGRLYTGRHWWGISNENTGAEPLTGRSAEQLARRLGLNFIPEGDTGTSIMIVGPVADVEGQTLEGIVQQTVSATMWWAWPHTVSDGLARPSVTFQFSHEGEPFHFPDPATHPALRHYVDAYQRASGLVRGTPPKDEGWPWVDKELRSGHGGRVLLGALSHRRLLPDQIVQPGDELARDVSHHVALMRSPRMVVKYLEAPQDPTGLGVAGVFIANKEYDRQFALSEPPAHDDWIPANLPREKFQRNHVRQALEGLRRELRPDSSATGAVNQGSAVTGVLAIANGLGALLDGSPIGHDAGVQQGGEGGIGQGRAAETGQSGDTGQGGGGSVSGAGKGTRTGRRAAIRVEGRPHLLLEDGRAVVRFAVTVTVPAGGSVRLHAEARVVLDGGAELPDEAPLGTEQPEVLGWSLEPDAGAERLLGDLTVNDSMQGVWVWLTQPPETAVTVVVQSENVA